MEIVNEKNQREARDWMEKPEGNNEWNSVGVGPQRGELFFYEGIQVSDLVNGAFRYKASSLC